MLWDIITVIIGALLSFALGYFLGRRLEYYKGFWDGYNVGYYDGLREAWKSLLVQEAQNRARKMQNRG